MSLSFKQYASFQSSKQVKNEMLSASNELEKLKGFIRNDLSTGGHQLERLSELDMALLNSGIAKLLNNVGCYLYLEKFKSSSVRVLTNALNVLLHISNPEISSSDEDQTPKLSDVAHNLRRVLMHLILKKDIGTVGSDFTDSAAVVLSNLLKAMITKETVEVKDSNRRKRSYKVDRGCDIITACVLVKTNAELHVGNVNTTMQLLTSAFCAIYWSNDCPRRKIMLRRKLRFARKSFLSFRECGLFTTVFTLIHRQLEYVWKRSETIVRKSFDKRSKRGVGWRK